MRVPLFERAPSLAPLSPPSRGRPPIHDTPLSRLCFESGITQSTLARGTGIHKSQIEFYWTGARKIRQPHLHLIAAFLDVSPRDLQSPTYF